MESFGETRNLHCILKQNSLGTARSLTDISEQPTNKSASMVCSTVTSGQYAAKQSASKLGPSTAVNRQLTSGKAHSVVINNILFEFQITITLFFADVSVIDSQPTNQDALSGQITIEQWRGILKIFFSIGVYM